jgi:Skp family chaperone for outer membrane proteins
MNAIKDVADADGYAMIIDVANNPSVVFTATRYDISDKVIGKLGYK